MEENSFSKVSREIDKADNNSGIDIIGDFSAQQLLLLIKFALVKKLKIKNMAVAGIHLNSDANIRAFQELLDLMTKNTSLLDSLESFTLTNTTLKPEDISNVVALIVRRKNLKSIDLSWNILNSSTIKYLVDWAKENRVGQISLAYTSLSGTENEETGNRKNSSRSNSKSGSNSRISSRSNSFANTGGNLRLDLSYSEKDLSDLILSSIGSLSNNINLKLEIIKEDNTEIIQLKDEYLTQSKLDQLKRLVEICYKEKKDIMLEFKECSIAEAVDFINFIAKLEKGFFSIENAKPKENALASHLLKVQSPIRDKIKKLICNDSINIPTLTQISKLTQLEIFQIPYATLSSDGVKAIVRLINGNKISSLNFNVGNFSTAELESIVMAIRSNTSIIELNIADITNNDNIGHGFWEQIEQSVYRNQLIQAIKQNDVSGVDGVIKTVQGKGIDIGSLTLSSSDNEEKSLLEFALEELPEEKERLQQRVEVIKRLYLAILETGKELDKGVLNRIRKAARATGHHEIKEIFDKHKSLTWSAKKVQEMEEKMKSCLLTLSSSTEIEPNTGKDKSADGFGAILEQLAQLRGEQEKLKNQLGILEPDIETKKMLENIQKCNPQVRRFQSKLYQTLFRSLHQIALNLRDDPSVLKKVGVTISKTLFNGVVESIPVVGNAAAATAKGVAGLVNIKWQADEKAKNEKILEKISQYIPGIELDKFCLKVSLFITWELAENIPRLNEKKFDNFIEIAADINKFIECLEQENHTLNAEEKIKFACKKTAKEYRKIITKDLQVKSLRNSGQYYWAKKFAKEIAVKTVESNLTTHSGKKTHPIFGPYRKEIATKTVVGSEKGNEKSTEPKPTPPNRGPGRESLTSAGFHSFDWENEEGEKVLCTPPGN